ncbi:MAG TPA: hypothetical protein PKU97_06445 [Kofleriaceae bacterium]|nr:hypothetical protein [Kofleriaceae bacterium]
MDPHRLQWRAVSKAGRGARSLFSKVPKAEAVMERVGRLARRKLGARVVLGADRLAMELHPAAKVALVAPADGVLELTIDAAFVGPGLAGYVLAQVELLLHEVDFVWQADAEGDAVSSPRDAAALQRGFAAWVKEQVAARAQGGSRQIGIPQDPQSELAGAVLLPLGPRDEPWCQAVLADPEAARDGWPLWQPATEATLALARGLWHLWMEVPWRAVTTDEDHALLARAHRELAAAFRLDASLPLPWAEWAELVDQMDLDDEVTAEVRARGVDGTPVAGYRRHPARFAVNHGWSLLLPAHCTITRQDDADTLAAADGERSLRCTCAESTGESAAAILAKIPMRSDVVERFDQGGQLGRIERREDEDYGVCVATGIMTTEDHAAVLTVLALPGDDEWALSVWRSLRRA